MSNPADDLLAQVKAMALRMRDEPPTYTRRAKLVVPRWVVEELGTEEEVRAEADKIGKRYGFAGCDVEIIE